MRKVVDRKTERSAKRPANPRASRSKKLSPAGAKIVSALQEAIDVVRSGESLPGRLTVRSFHAEFVRPSYGAADVRRVRDLLGMSQVVFARFLGVDPNTVRSWEQGTRPPSSIARRFMGEIEHDPAYWRRRIAQRLWTNLNRSRPRCPWSLRPLHQRVGWPNFARTLI
jgi:putative transcriptional regulator